jgi:acyl-CoA thioesterase
MSDSLADLHPLDAATLLTPGPGGTLIGSTSPAYGNMAGPFGGATAALMLRAALEHEKRIGEPVAQTVNFCAAIADGEFALTVHEIRSGRSVQHLYVELRQGETIAANATIVCAVRAATWTHQSAQMPAAPPADAVPLLTGKPPLAWLSRYDFRYAEGPPFIPGTAHAEPQPARSVVWVADNPARPLDHLSLAALCDIFIIRIYQVRGTRTPSGTVSITSYFHASAEELAAQGTRPVLAKADSMRFGGQFFDQQGEVWSDAGKLLASTTQVVWFRD